MNGRELRECALFNTYMLCITYGQGCCTAEDVECVCVAVGRGLLCVWMHRQCPACAVCAGQMCWEWLRVTRGYFAVK